MSQVDKTLAKKKRSRAGCTRCRRQRKRCDEQKPACARCQEVGTACSYELNIKWGGRAFPKMLGTYAERVQRLDNADEGGGFVYVAQTQASSAQCTPKRPAISSPEPQPAHPSHQPDDDYTEPDNTQTPCPDPDTPSTSIVVRQARQRPWELETEFNRPVRALTLAPNLSRMHRFLLDHYVHQTIRLTAPSDYARTEICRSVVPMSYNQPCLLFAMMAFAARHLFALGALPVDPAELPGDSAEQVIAALEDRSMRSLRQQLTEPNFSQHAVALATTRTLCQSQILAAGNAWRTHLEGARAILQAASQKSKSSRAVAPAADRHAAHAATADDVIQDYLASWYNNVEALAALTPLGLRRGQLETAPMRGRRNVYFDVFGGLVSDVPDLFREVGALVMERRRRASRDSDSHDNGGDDNNHAILSDDDIALEAASLVRDIHARLARDTLGSLRMDNNLLASLSPDNMHDYALSNASFLHTALLYIHGAVQGLPLSAPAVRRSVEQIVWCYGSMKSASALSPRVLMGTPLFTAGLWATPDVQPAIRGYFATMGTWMRTPHNVRSSALLEFVWSKTSSGQHDVLTYLEESPDFLPY